MVIASPALAVYAPFNPPYADNAEHTYISTESNSYYRDYWDPYFDGEIDGQYDANTVLFDNELVSYSTNVDVYWYSEPASSSSWGPGDGAVAAKTTCMEYVSGSTTVCNRFRVMIKDDATGLSSLLSKNLACHELGHTVGFRDGGNNGTSCMDGGENGAIDDWEISHINAYYS